MKAEEFFWKNLPKHNLTSQNVIDRQKVNFDDIIELMEQYARNAYPNTETDGVVFCGKCGTAI